MATPTTAATAASASFKRLFFTFEKKLSTKSKVTIGIASSLPIISAFQTIYFLRDYRINHRDAPRPISPSSGLAIANQSIQSIQSNQQQQQQQHQQHHVNNNNNNSTIPPLRLYVVGDSLAAGTGISKSGTPILPESIAQSLSKQLGGRPVYWFCHGTNGASANRINSDIQNHFINCDATAVDTTTTNAAVVVNKDHDDRGVNIPISADQVFFKCKGQFVKWKRLILEWLQKRIISSRSLLNANLEKMSDTPPDNDTPPSSSSPHSDTLKQMLQNSSRKNAYDVVVVLTGLNDLKGFFPFLANDNCRNHSTFKEELRNIFVTLKDRMNKKKKQQKQHSIDKLTINQLKTTTHHHNDDDDEDDDDDYDDATPTNSRTPIVVIPALPVGLVPLFQYPPLCWFSQLIFDFIDRQKQDLSKEYPGQILFVSPPTTEMAACYLYEKTSRNQWQAENVSLLLQDVSARTKKKIEALMREYRNVHVDKNERNNNDDDDDDDFEMEKNLEESIQHNICKKEESCVGSSLISIDKVHPNDDGYEFWGRHIAEAIIQEMKIHKPSKSNRVHA